LDGFRLDRDVVTDDGVALVTYSRELESLTLRV
jgi:hypothetical protein